MIITCGYVDNLNVNLWIFYFVLMCYVCVLHYSPLVLIDNDYYYISLIVIYLFILLDINKKGRLLAYHYILYSMFTMY